MSINTEVNFGAHLGLYTHMQYFSRNNEGEHTGDGAGYLSCSEWLGQVGKRQ